MTVTPFELRQKCRVPSPGVGTRTELDRWLARARRDVAAHTQTLVAQPLSNWVQWVDQHSAHRHPVYDYLADRATLADFATLFFENQGVPPFIELVRKTAQCQITPQGREAIERNIADEAHPVPHHALMQRLLKALQPHWIADPTPAESLIQRQLTLYSGYHLHPWQLVGSLFAIECMGSSRMQKMWKGLSRLHLDDSTMEFVRIHIHCDEHHAAEWCAEVIGPSLAREPSLRETIARGVALTLAADAAYLTELHARRDGAGWVRCRPEIAAERRNA